MASCSTFVPVSKTLPPEIRLPDNKGDFLFISRFNADSLPFNNDNKVEVFKLGHNAFLQGLSAGFDTSRYFHLTLADTIIGNTAPVEPANDLSATRAEQLCTIHNKGYLLTLDAYNLYFDQEVDVVKLEDGTKERTAYYDLVVETYIGMYNRYGQVLDRYRDELRIQHDKRSVISGLLAVGPSMGKADKNAKLISDELGRKFIHKFYPVSVVEQREFYHTKGFSRAYKAYQMGHWAEVENELLPLTRSEESKIAGRAAYNMAVLCENLNRLDEMTYWYGVAQEKLGDKMPTWYN
ncbi:hypothetical protein C900_02534 [Fulvivirga imtechensis AK7]|uniref:Uncharacterized protein n=2 Tax=Fulvivirga TaxID=396811 RepID=L8JR68_9BACT|nr:hypothetical protein C900_02534 [Fulvivirga imtechensis AK7]